jgi:predicted RNase H-like nuclease
VSWVAGADGCRAGWMVVLRNVRTGAVRVRLVATFGQLLRLTESPRITCVDIPIGLLEHAEAGGRACDRAARRLLGRPRSASVFSPPVRACLTEFDYAHALAVSRASSPAGIGISRQTFGIMAKVREADVAMRPATQTRVKEAHPELAFMVMNHGVALGEGKRSGEGQVHRLALLKAAGFRDPLGSSAEVGKHGVGIADILDAHACCVTASRIESGTAVRVPDKPPRDARGLAMEIWR